MVSGYHIDERDVEEHAGGDGEQPARGGGRVPRQHAAHHARQAQPRRQDVVAHGAPHRHARLQQHREVAWRQILHLINTKLALLRFHG